MRIAIIQSFLPSVSNGGVGHFAHQLANGLVDCNHQVTVYSLDPAPAAATYNVIRPASTDWLTRSRVGRLYGFACWLARQNLQHYDVIHAMGDNHLLRTSTPVVRTFH